MERRSTICDVYAHRIDNDSFLYVTEKVPFPVRLIQSEWRLLMVGVEAPPALSMWLATRDYHITTGAALGLKGPPHRP